MEEKYGIPADKTANVNQEQPTSGYTEPPPAYPAQPPFAYPAQPPPAYPAQPPPAYPAQPPPAYPAQPPPAYPAQAQPGYMGPPQPGYPVQQQPGYPVQQQLGYQGQQQVIITMPPANRVSNNLVLAVISTVCCCPVCGIIGIIYASQVDSAYLRGEVDRAQANADNARKWSIAAIFSGFAWILIIIIYYIIFFAVIMN